ncbi:alpha/beta fold hydrolase [Streptomyces roseochromogenus]|uniref:alpha/beta fold hydrolase n=1 Tax=Streptomyces roseochromogenus TaxID=285450 RepID=UPI0009965F83|nr:alpha/beta hydrolase [Streptomyces roseochromogenus]
MTSRHDALPRAFAGLLAGLAMTGVAAQALRHRRVMRGRGNESLFETSRGNILAYRFTESAGVSSDTPVLVFETGMAATAEYWYWAELNLGLSYPTLVYSRAGYGRSEFRDKEPFTLRSAVLDLEDLIRDACGNRPVVIVGHSLGGYLALRAAEEMRDLVRGLCLLDPSHPGELLRSPAQAKGAEHVSFSLTLMPSSLRLGFGGLLEIPLRLKQFPADLQGLFQDQYRDWKLWEAAKREWRATREEFLRYNGDLPKIGVPTCLVAADRTRSTDNSVAELYSELVAAAPRSEMHVVERAGHDELLLRKEVFNLIRQFGESLEADQDKARKAS